MCIQKKMRALTSLEDLTPIPLISHRAKAPICSCNLCTPTSANDEMEFVKMRYKCPAQSSFRDHQRHGTDHTTSLESLGPTNGGPPSLVSSEKPPSYDTFINDATIPPYYATAMATGGTMAAGTSAQTATVPIYATVDRRSLRSKASQRSKSSKNKDKRKELPWVHVTPSSNYLDYSHHHHHHHHP